MGGDETLLANVGMFGSGDLPSAFAVSDLAAASVGAAALAIAEFIGSGAGRTPEIAVDRRLASLWFANSLKPVGWSVPPVWDPIAGDYPAADGWIRLHTNAPHHRAAALSVLGVPADGAAVAKAVGGWLSDELETAVVGGGGCAAAMRSLASWADHPQGRRVASEPLVWHAETDGADTPSGRIDPQRPLAGIRVLDLTRVLAGPVATRFLAGFGAEVLRIDPPDWDEPGVVPEVTLGKSCARLNLHQPKDRERFVRLLADADILVHGYRPDALDKLGLGETRRRTTRPGLVDVSLDAYGWTGPWAGRRGFDSLVQMSVGIAEEGMRCFGKDRPAPLPVQALDHATGYIMAAAVVRGLTTRLARGVGFQARTSLARTAALLVSHAAPRNLEPLTEPTRDDFGEQVESTSWGPAWRMRPPVSLVSCSMSWTRPATELGSSQPSWT